MIVFVVKSELIVSVPFTVCKRVHCVNLLKMHVSLGFFFLRAVLCLLAVAKHCKIHMLRANPRHSRNQVAA